MRKRMVLMLVAVAAFLAVMRRQVQKIQDGMAMARVPAPPEAVTTRRLPAEVAAVLTATDRGSGAWREGKARSSGSWSSHQLRIRGAGREGQVRFESTAAGARQLTSG